LNKAMDGLGAINDTFINMQATVKRLETMGFQGDAEKVTQKTLDKFNGEVKAGAMAAGRQFTPVDVAGLKAYNETYDRYLRKGWNELTDVEKKALSVGSDVAGGYLVSPDLTGRAVARMFETSPMRTYASQQTISTDALEGTVDLEEASFGWVSELGARSESNTPAVPAPWRIPVHEAYSEPRISQKLAEDASSDPVAWLARKVGDKFGRGYNTAFVTGTGIGKPRGFGSYTTAATADASRSWGVFEHNATGSSGAFGADPGAITDLTELIHAMKDHFLTNAAWYMNRTTLGYLRTKTDASSAGKFIFLPSFQAGHPDTIMGYPVRKLQDMATYSTADALAIAFGDMAECYQIVDRLGLTTLVDPYTTKPYIKYYTRGRVGGDVLNFEAMKFIKFGTS
jgi:HK97 family phage major capsid protein